MPRSPASACTARIWAEVRQERRGLPLDQARIDIAGRKCGSRQSRPRKPAFGGHARDPTLRERPESRPSASARSLPWAITLAIIGS